ncbi:MAG: hypothetical protein HY017_32285 [Betaproteobacteria bacterium]|nr:hypothetical protein [Betaproteobacteria bacterium]
MDKRELYTLIVTHADGSREHFRFPIETDKLRVSSLIEKLLSSAVLSLQLKGRLLIIPSNNIRSVELFPSPEKLPDIVLHDVERVSAED